ncbi:hypothetical protein [Colwellia psychrerythraea]|uniref:N-acetyltransferase domain-containing protein n=1 Tax=Colwellia psychrerythraea (strain 34H / ATCC BAA-681) TaxID=167879 RepID=Q47U77_COLP3|nr:hypothetical protein [Colwellia psychrerythraea]AAZ24784.1 hypothetical protein CPS_5007 [Colwellia psychrerythraea 34H]
MVIHKINKLIATIKTQGIRKAIVKVAAQFKFSYKYYFIYTYNLNSSSPAIAVNEAINTNENDYSIKWWSESDFCKNKTTYLEKRSDMTDSYIENWLPLGHQTVVARSLPNNDIIGDMWLAFDNFPFPSKSKSLRDWAIENHYGYAFMAFVQPSHRGKKILPCLMNEQLKLVKDNNKKGLMALIMPKSKSSHKSFSSMGFKRVGKLHVLQLFSNNHTWISV